MLFTFPWSRCKFHIWPEKLAVSWTILSVACFQPRLRPSCNLVVTFCDHTSRERKLEILGSIVLRLLHPEKFWVKIFLSTQDGIKHPEMHTKLKVGKFFWRWKKILDEKKNFEKKTNNFSKNESCLKLPELPRNHVWRGGVLPQTDNYRWHRRVTCRVTPCMQQGMTKKKKGCDAILPATKMNFTFLHFLFPFFFQNFPFLQNRKWFFLKCNRQKQIIWVNENVRSLVLCVYAVQHAAAPAVYTSLE